MDSNPSQDELTPIENAILAGRKIEAIKLYREMTQASLADAKSAVDDTEARLRAESPEHFAKLAGKSGCTVTIGGCIGIVVSAWMLLS